MAKQAITKDMTIGEVINKHPKTVFVLIDYGLHCVGCSVSGGESVEEAARAHRMDLKKFLRDLNKAAKKA